MEPSIFQTKLTKQFAANDRLRSALAEYQSLMGVTATKIESLSGTGNQSFKITLEQGEVVLRLNADSRLLGVDRQIEKLILETIAGLGIAPELKLWREDYLVIEFTNSSAEVTTSSITKTLHALHQVPVPAALNSKTLWTPVETIRDYLKLAPDAVPAFAEHLVILDRFDWLSLPYGVCHIDLNPNNILQPLDTETAQFIDWEYARQGPIAYDFAVLCETHHLSSAQVDDLRSDYPDAPSIQEIEMCKFAYRLIERLWLHLTAPNDHPLNQLMRDAREISLA